MRVVLGAALGGWLGVRLHQERLRHEIYERLKLLWTETRSISRRVSRAWSFLHEHLREHGGIEDLSIEEPTKGGHG